MKTSIGIGIEIDCLSYADNRPEVFFWYHDVAMSADLDPGVVAPVVVKGTAQGAEVDVNFHDYEGLQVKINEYASGRSRLGREN